MPGDRASWEALADGRPETAERMRAVAEVLRGESVTTLASYGVGGGLAECWLLRLMPELQLTMTDYGEETVAALRELVGSDARAVRHDLLQEPPLPADAHLFHRIDTEFRGGEWRRIMARFADQLIVLVATDVYAPRRMGEELRAMFHRRHWTRAGWIRTRGAFERLWQSTHRAEPLALGDLEGWLLRPKA
jgi:hypothetical protein